MRNEKDVKAEVKKILNALGAWWYMPVQTGYGVRGIPDFVCCLGGRFAGIETKFGNNKESAHQKMQGAKIDAAGGLYIVINEHNVVGLASVLRALGALHGQPPRNGDTVAP